jgi:hypothetical protein
MFSPVRDIGEDDVRLLADHVDGADSNVLPVGRLPNDGLQA